MAPTPSHLGVTQATLSFPLCAVFLEFRETLICGRFNVLTQPSSWSVQLILCCVVYLNKLAEVFTR